MRRLDAISLFSTLGMVACATQVPLDLTGLMSLYDAGEPDAGFGGFANSSGGLPSEFGGFTASGGFGVTGGTPFAHTGGRAQMGMGMGGRMPNPVTGGAPPTVTGGRSGTATGGAPSTSGSKGAGGADCRGGEKVCGGVCVSPAPRTGCGLTGCDACSTSAPANGVVICNSNHQCDISCLSGFTRNGNTCEGPPPGAGGSTGGPSGSCGGQSCPSCSVILGPSCCTTAGKCGCPLIPWTAGFLGCI